MKKKENLKENLKEAWTKRIMDAIKNKQDAPVCPLCTQTHTGNHHPDCPHR